MVICSTYSMSHHLNNLKVIPLKYPGLYKNIYLMHISNQIGMRKINSFLQSIFIMGKNPVRNTFCSVLPIIY